MQSWALFVRWTIWGWSGGYFQMSCQKEATAQQTGSNYILPSATTSTLGGVIIGNGLSVTSNGTLSVNSSNGLKQLGKIIFIKNVGTSNNFQEVWTANYDGTNQKKVDYTIPNGVTVPFETDAKLSPDGQTVFITFRGNWSGSDIYSCKIDGTNIQKIISSGDGVGIAGVY